MSKYLKAIDLFAGIGGIRLGFEQAFGPAVRTVFISEWDKFAQQTYTTRDYAAVRYSKMLSVSANTTGQK